MFGANVMTPSVALQLLCITSPQVQQLEKRAESMSLDGSSSAMPCQTRGEGGMTVVREFPQSQITQLLVP